MKKLILFFSFIIIVGCTSAQTYQPPVTIPPYHILTTDSTYATPAELKKNKPVMIVYFSPDCPHCQHLVRAMNENVKGFSNVQIILISFIQKLQPLKDFYRDYDLKKYPGIVVGTEGYTYVVQRFYQVRTTPYIAIYDKKDKLVKAYDKVPEMKDLVAAVKNL